IYKVLVLTGLRRGELASLTVASVVLNAATPCLILQAAHAKNYQRAELPLRSDLADDLANWIEELQTARTVAIKDAQNILSMGGTNRPALPANTPLFPAINQELIKVFDRDLSAAGI